MRTDPTRASATSLELFNFKYFETYGQGINISEIKKKTPITQQKAPYQTY